MSTVSKTAYLLEHEWEHEARRLELLEQHADPTTRRRLAEVGVGPGWRCLEVGAGRGSIARWLAEGVGPTGQVVALDLDTTLMEGLDEDNIDVVAGDVLEIEFERASFDLIHTRLVLMHIPERRRAIERMVGWLRPGGWLVVEELDWMAMTADPNARRTAVFRAYNEALETIDFECGRALPGEVEEAGLLDTAVDFHVDVVDGATPRALWDQLSMLALADEVLAAGTATAEEIADQLAALEDPDYRGYGWAWVGVRGRRGLTDILS